MKRDEYKDNFIHVRPDGNGEFDELWATNADIHIERMNATGWWMGIDLPNGDKWMLNFGAVNQRAKFFFNVEKDSLSDEQCFGLKGKP